MWRSEEGITLPTGLAGHHHWRTLSTAVRQVGYFADAGRRASGPSAAVASDTVAPRVLAGPPVDTPLFDLFAIVGASADTGKRIMKAYSSSQSHARHKRALDRVSEGMQPELLCSYPPISEEHSHRLEKLPHLCMPDSFGLGALALPPPASAVRGSHK